MARSSNFTLSLLDALLACLGGVVFLMVLFAALRRPESTEGEPSEHIVVRVLSPQAGIEFQDELSIFIGRLAPRGGLGELTNVQHLEDAVRSGATQLVPLRRPSDVFPLALELAPAEMENWVLGVWVRSADDESAGAVLGVKPVRISVERLGPDGVFVEAELTAETHFLQTFRLDSTLSRQQNLRLRWTSPRRLPLDDTEARHRRYEDIRSAVFHPKSGIGYLPSPPNGPGPPANFRVLAWLDEIRQPLTPQRASLSALAALPVKPEYSAIGRRGVGALLADGSLWVRFTPESDRLLAAVGLTKDPASGGWRAESADADAMFHAVLARSGQTRGTIDWNAFRHRIVDAIAHGMSYSDSSPACRQDPLLLIPRGRLEPAAT